MKLKGIVASSIALAAVTISGAATAQAWGPPPPPPPYGYAPPPPPGPPPVPGSRVVQRWQWGQRGYHFYRPHCWIEYRNGGWEMVKVCQ